MACDFINNISDNKLFIALLGAIFGGVISYLVGVGLYVKRAFYEHAIRFKHAFINELYAIEMNGGNPSKILPQAMKKHDLAIFEFIRILPWHKRKALANAWDEYRRNPNKQRQVDLTHYYFEDQTSEEQGNRRNLIAKRLSKIISFAE